MSKVARNNYGRSIDGMCSFPECDQPATDLISQPICTRHALKVYKAAQALVEDATPAQKVEAADLDQLGVVYFMQKGERVKIGYTTDLGRRMRDIPHDRVLAAIPGSKADESRFHATFVQFRDVGEWFQADPDLLHAISRFRYQPAA